MVIILNNLISILEIIMMFADFAAHRRFQKVLAKVFDYMNQEHINYIARWNRIGHFCSNIGIIPLLGSAVASILGSFQWSTIGLAVGAICFTLSWHINSLMTNKLKEINQSGQKQ